MQYLLRSMLFVPGNRGDLHKKAAKSEADTLILDMEDSILDKLKSEARETIIRSLAEGVFKNKVLFVRLNDLDSGHLLKDITKLTIDGITGFIYPKSYSEKDIIFFDSLLTAVEKDKGFNPGKFKIIPLLETASAILRVEKICQVSSRIIAAVYGSEDFVADIHGIHDKEGKALFYPRARVVLAARAAGIIPIDTLHVNIHDLDDLEENLKLAKTLGFEGMLLLHPKEIELAHKYFSPTQEELERARKIITLSEKAARENIRIAIIDNTFIGPPMLTAARNIIKRQQLINEKKLVKNGKNHLPNSY